MTIKHRTLEQLHRRRTSYEVEFVTNGKAIHLGFTQKRTLKELVRFCYDNADTIRPYLDKERDTESSYHDGVLTFGPTNAIRYSGRTERDFASAAHKG